MSKKLFKELIKRASQPVPKEADKQLHPDVNSAKQTHPRKIADASPKRRDKSPQSNS